MDGIPMPKSRFNGFYSKEYQIEKAKDGVHTIKFELNKPF
jgi:hypothetical protein